MKAKSDEDDNGIAPGAGVMLQFRLTDPKKPFDRARVIEREVGAAIVLVEPALRIEIIPAAAATGTVTLTLSEELNIGGRARAEVVPAFESISAIEETVIRT